MNCAIIFDRAKKEVRPKAMAYSMDRIALHDVY